MNSASAGIPVSCLLTLGSMSVLQCVLLPSVLNVKALVGAFSVIVKSPRTFVQPSFQALVSILYTNSPRVHARLVHQPERLVQMIVVEAGEAGQVQQQQAQRVQTQAELRQLHHLE